MALFLLTRKATRAALAVNHRRYSRLADKREEEDGEQNLAINKMFMAYLGSSK
jgi:hypothetical protein